MREQSALRCPVCRREKPALALSDFDCNQCGFHNAYLQFFAGTASRSQWETEVRKARAERQTAQRVNYAHLGAFTVGSHCVAFLDPQKGRLSLALGTGQLQVEKNVRGFSSSERNDAVVYTNGTVKVFGTDNSFGQKDTSAWNQIRFVLSAPNCTYGVTHDGAVLIQGAPLSDAVRQWQGIQTLACGAQHIVGLREDGTVYLAGVLPDSAAAAQIKAWRNVIQIATARDCVVGLHRNGTVSFVGKPHDSRGGVQQWQDIVAVACDNSYVYGLTQTGHLCMAGTCKSFLDKGRAKAVEWNKIMAISCNAAGIGAVDNSGNLYFAGTINGDDSRIAALWQEQIQPQME